MTRRHDMPFLWWHDVTTKMANLLKHQFQSIMIDHNSKPFKTPILRFKVQHPLVTWYHHTFHEKKQAQHKNQKLIFLPKEKIWVSQNTILGDPYFFFWTKSQILIFMLSSICGDTVSVCPLPTLVTWRISRSHHHPTLKGNHRTCRLALCGYQRKGQCCSSWSSASSCARCWQPSRL